jgi:diguanylate cyclase (GGDEF)-like protein/hemerythrin-like metal-binding protein/PAS domain S-box-containing protein
MKVIDIFPWDDHFNVGISKIDQQHQRLVELLNLLAREVVCDTKSSRLNEIFNELLDYTIYHFQTEESIWAEYFSTDSMLTQHKEVHQTFIDSVMELKAEQNERSSSEIAQETLGFLVRWLASHILETDRFMAYIVVAIESGMDMESSKKQAKETMSGFTRTLVNLILSIYEKLSNNTLQLMYELRNHQVLENTFAETNNLLMSVIDTSPVRIFWKDKDLNYLGCNLVFAKDAGEVNSENIIGKNDFQLCWSDQAELYRADDFQVMESGVPKLFFEEQQTTTDGSIIWLSTSKVPLYNKQNEVIGIIGLYEEITTRKNAEIALKAEKETAQNYLDIVGVMILVLDLNKNVKQINRYGCEILGYTAEEIIGKNWAENFTPLRCQNSIDDIADSLLQNEQKSITYFENLVLTKNGEEHLIAWRNSTLYDQDGKVIGILTSGEDITERKANEERIHYLANFDSLTELPNRNQLDIRVKELLSLSARHNNKVAIMFLDLDHFKDINDSLGHNTGDQLLVEVSKRLKSVLRQEDTIARLGGDEFIILLPNISMLGASQVAQKLLDIFKASFVIEAYELKISGSIGIALFPSDGADFETLYKNADTAMYRAKQDGRSRFNFFTEEMQKNTSRMLKLSNALSYALERNELQLYYQPQFSTNNKAIIGAEALLRWSNSELGSVSPAEFIPIAEENGTILSIGEWVLRTAIEQTKKWMDEGMAPIIMAVNLSAVQFRIPNLSSLISNILKEVGLPPEYLELELTEGVAMNDPQKAIAIMNDLHNQGIRMSIDDFGTGYSSLSYLKKFKVYKLKIDQSFVRDINIDPEDKAIVGAIISMAKNLGLQTIAEGVETIGQLNYLQEQGCDEIQGYYFSKPLSKEDFETFRIQK